MNFKNIMDYLQLLFSFFNAPLFATFLLGMFWKRSTGHGAFFGLVAGTLTAFGHYLLVHNKVLAYPSEMASNFYGAIYAFTACFVLTVAISLVTRPKEEAELVGLVYSLTPKPEVGHLPWFRRPGLVGAIVLGVTLVLNFVFW
jgi:SSS family solute:Na+ symporter